MKKFVAFIMIFCSLSLAAQTGLPAGQMTQADNLIKNFMNTYGIPGLTFAMAKNGKIVYMKGFGYADKAKTIPTQPYNLFRIASCSKQITSIAIMKLMQDGKLKMSDKPFGVGGILEHHPSYASATITDNRIYNITVQQLLEHSAGWDRTVNCNPNPTTPYPWFIGGCDPIDGPLRVSQQLGISNPVTENGYIKYLLQKGLNFAPGTKYAYSNIGYLVLGAIIEQLTGTSYEDYIQTNILHPLGIYDMHIGKNLLADKLEREVEYVGGEGNNLSVYGDGTLLPWEYGGMNVTAMSAHGGWVATAKDMLTLLTAVDGFNTKPDILSPATINTMVAPAATSANYAKGWQVNSFNNWWHTGAVPGTASQQVRANNGYTWVVIMNHRYNSNNFWSALDNLGWNVISSTTTWPTIDLMLAPTQNASGITFSNVTPTSITVSWTNGNGGNRLLSVKPLAAKSSFPLDGTSYTANADYTKAADLGSNNKVVYSGSGNSVTVTGLTPGETYSFRIFEYNNSAETGNNELYLRGNNPQADQATTGSLPLNLLSFTASRQGQSVNLNWLTAQEVNTKNFVVQRSTNGSGFENIGSLDAKGNTSAQNAYSFTDAAALNLRVNKVYYRLKMADKDGTISYSAVASVNLQKNNSYALLPNPAKDVVTVKGGAITRVEILTIAGKGIRSQSYAEASDPSINISALAKGMYVVKVVSKDGSVENLRLVKN